RKLRGVGVIRRPRTRRGEWLFDMLDETRGCSGSKTRSILPPVADTAVDPMSSAIIFQEQSGAGIIELQGCSVEIQLIGSENISSSRHRSSERRRRIALDSVQCQS